MRVVAHRGFCGRYPENTMLSFKKAVETGCDEIEMDIQLTKDGQVVIIHDENIDRVTGTAGLVRELTYEELKKYDASSIFKGKYGFNPVPTLEEYFAWASKQQVSTNIELKTNVYFYNRLVEKAIELIKKYKVEDRVMFSSFNHASLILAKKEAPYIPCGALTDRPVGNVGCYLKQFGFEFYHPNGQKLTDDVVADCRKNGIRLNVWTVNDMDTMHKLLEWDCYGAISDYPDICRAIAREQKK